jgi:hypothetical protein
MRAGRSIPVVTLAALLFMSSAAGGGKKNPDEIFRQIFYALEKTMGIKISPSGFNISLLAGKVSVPSMVIEHPVQGKFAVLKNIEFPIGLLLGTVKPEQATVQIDRADVVIDLSKGKFWDSGTSDGKPIPGAPDLVAGKIVFKSASVTVRHGGAGAVLVKDTKAALSKVDIPAESWSRGDAPAGTWARASMEGGGISLEGAGLGADLESLEIAFNAEVMSVDKLEMSIPGHGKVALQGKVDCGGGEPGGYDLSVSLESFKLFHDEPVDPAGGALKLKGKKGSMVLKGCLAAGGMKSRTWSRPNCKSGIKLDIKVKKAQSTKKASGSISGNLCSGKISMK